MPSQYNLVGPAILANPYPLYHQLQSRYPVHLDSHFKCWVVTRYMDIVSALANSDFSSERAKRIEGLHDKEWIELAPLFAHVSNLMFYSDPPKHTRIRSLVSKALSSRMLEKLRPYIQQIVDELLDAVEMRGKMDIIGDFAYPLPARVISDLLGIPDHDRIQFKQWSDDLADFLGNPPSLDQCTRLHHSMQAFREYFQSIVAMHRTYPTDDLVSALISAEDRGIVLTEDELLVNCAGLFAGGHETTTNLLGNGLLALIQHREQMQKLRDNPHLIASAVEELLRYDSPVQFMARVAKQTTEIGGKKIYKGQSVMLMVGAANRDPEVFQEPDVLEINRSNSHRHLSFGHNIHFCIGGGLARLEAQIAISALLKRMPNLKLEAGISLKWRNNLSFHGLEALPVTF